MPSVAAPGLSTRASRRWSDQLDGADWAEAKLGRVPLVDTWVQWSARVDVDPGEHRLVVRATDGSGYTQTSVETDVVPDGASGWDSVAFDAS